VLASRIMHHALFSATNNDLNVVTIDYRLLRIRFIQG
jgi:hypothetical protein